VKRDAVQPGTLRSFPVDASRIRWSRVTWASAPRAVKARHINHSYSRSRRRSDDAILMAAKKLVDNQAQGDKVFA